MLRRYAYAVKNFIGLISWRFMATVMLLYLEFKQGKGNGIFLRMKALSMGFTSDMLKYFNTINKDYYRTCASEFDTRFRINRIDEDYGILLNDKRLMYNYFCDFSEYLPKLYFHINNGKFLGNGTAGESIEDVTEVLKKVGRLVLKETMGYGGKQVYMLEYHEGKGVFLHNGKTVDLRGFLEGLLQSKKEYIITEFVKQASYASGIYSGSTNTIRILTYYDFDTNECWIGGATHRFGRDTTGFVDNMTAGGLIAAVDIASGRLGQGILPTKNYEYQKIDFHPGSAARITGVNITNWELIREKILELAFFANKNPYIGWDVVSTEKGFKLLETNAQPDIQLIQFHTPALLDERNRRFFAKYNVKPK